MLRANRQSNQLLVSLVLQAYLDTIPNLRGLPAPDVSSLPFSILFHYFKGNIPQETQFPPGHENGNTHHLARLRWIWCSCVQRPWGSGKSRGSLLIFFIFSCNPSLSKIHQNACSYRCGDIARAQQVDDSHDVLMFKKRTIFRGQHGQFVFVIRCRLPLGSALVHFQAAQRSWSPGNQQNPAESDQVVHPVPGFVDLAHAEWVAWVCFFFGFLLEYTDWHLERLWEVMIDYDI